MSWCDEWRNWGTAQVWGVVNAATLRRENEKLRENWEAEKLAMEREVLARLSRACNASAFDPSAEVREM